MIPMIATMRQVYEGTPLYSGSRFNAKSELDAKDLIAMRMAMRDPQGAVKVELSAASPTVAPEVAVSNTVAVEDAPQPEGYTARDQAATEDAEEPVEDDKQGNKGSSKGYNRRDMRARR